MAAFAPRIAAKHPIYIYIIRRKRRAQKTAFFLHALHPEERWIFYGPCRTSKKRSTPTKTSFATQAETGHCTILNGRKRLIFIKCAANLNIHIKHSASAPPAQLLFFPNPRTAAMRCTIYNRRKRRIFTEFTANRSTYIEYPSSTTTAQSLYSPETASIRRAAPVYSKKKLPLTSPQLFSPLLPCQFGLAGGTFPRFTPRKKTAPHGAAFPAFLSGALRPKKRLYSS